MISPLYYHTFYLVFVALLSVILIVNYNNRYTLTNGIKGQDVISVIVLILIVVFIGMRPNHIVFQDSVAYARWYDGMEGESFNWAIDENNVLYTSLLFFIASLKLGVNTFFIIIAFIYFGGIMLCCRLLFKKHSLYAFVAYLAAFSTYSYSVNGIKAGAAAAIFLVGLGLIKHNKWWSVFFVLLSYGFHHSMIMCIIAYFVVSLYNKNTKHYFYLWAFCFFIAAAHIIAFQNYFGSLLADHGDKGAIYLLDGTGYRTGMRYDFVLYSAMPIWIGYIAKFKKKIISKNYDFLLHLYMLTNSMWMLCMYASFTNRIAYLSWFMYPIVLLYPFVSSECAWGNDRGRYLKRIVILHLGFTLAMHFIYYA